MATTKTEPKFSKELLNDMNLVQLKKMAKTHKMKKYSTLNRKDLIDAILNPPMVIKEETGDKSQEAMDKFIEDGGEVTQCKPGKRFKTEPPTQKSALKSGRAKQKLKKVKAGKTLKKKPKSSTPKRNNPDIITLKNICEELDIGSYKVRKHFRIMKLAKPGKQWAWDKSQTKEIEEIKSLINKLKGE